MRSIKEGYSKVLEFISRDNKKGQISYDTRGFTVKGSVGSEDKIILECDTNVLIDCSLSNVFEITLTTDVSNISFVNATIGSYIFIIKQDAVGSHTVSFPTSLCYAINGTLPTITATAGAIDIIGVLYDGNYFYIFPTQNLQNTVA